MYVSGQLIDEVILEYMALSSKLLVGSCFFFLDSNLLLDQLQLDPISTSGLGKVHRLYF